MHAEVKTWDRNNGLFFNKGNVKRGEYEEFDLANIRILHTGVDTFKQLFRGLIDESALSIITAHYDSAVRYPIVFGDYQFNVSKAGSKSGFQWVLKNYDLGVIVMLKSFYAESDAVGTHLKVEYSPHLIENSDALGIDQISLDLASIFLTEFEFADVAVHIAVDLKGWDVPGDIERNLRTRAKRQFTFAGVSEFDFDVNAVAVKYGTKESFTFGGAGSLQLCIYDKSKEIQVRDKVHFWSGIWGKTPGVDDPFEPEYQAGDSVQRIEARFHHSVVRQFCKGTNGMEVTNFSQLVPHLTGLYQYMLDNFRLHHSKNFIHPVWQLLMEDVQILAPLKPLIYQRSYKTESANSRRNVAFWLGNAMRLFARQSFTVDAVVNYFMQSGLNRDLKAYCNIPPNASDGELFMVLHDFVRKRMEQHAMDGVHH